MKECCVDGCEFSAQDGIIFLMACGVNEEFRLGLRVYDCRSQCGAGVHLGAVGVNPRVRVPSSNEQSSNALCGCCCITRGSSRSRNL